MTSLRSAQPRRSRAFRILATVVAGVVVLLLANVFQGSGQDAATGVATSSLLSVPSSNQPDAPEDTVPAAEPTAIATTAPLQLPVATATPLPTATPPPTATPAPTATTVPAPEPTATLEPDPTAVIITEAAEPAEVSVADANAIAPDPTPVPATPVPEPTATSIPTPTAQPFVEPTAVEEPTPEPTATPEPAAPPGLGIAGLEAYVLGEINQVRANAGLGPLALDPNLSAISRDWSQQMATGGFFYHRPGPELSAMLPAGWREWGENIASAPDIFYAQSSLEASPGHYANMVGNFTVVGIGVYANGSQVWVTQNFARY